MTSVSVQADISDPEGILGVIRSFHEELQDLQRAGRNLIELTKARAERVRTSEALSNELSDKIEGLAQGADNISERFQNEEGEGTDVDQELQDLLNEKEKLDSVLNQLQEKANANAEPLRNDQRLIGYAEEELSKKVEELSHLHQRLANAREAYQTEWNDFKAELKQFEEERSSYEETVDHLEELQLARCVGAQAALGADASGAGIVERLLENQQNKTVYRDLQKKITQLNIEEKDLEDEIGGLVKQKQNLWQRCLDLEKCLEETHGSEDTTEETVSLRPAAAFADLAHMAEGHSPATEEGDELETGPEITHGRLLHRCQKQTNLVIDLSAEERSELETLAQIRTDAGEPELDAGGAEELPEAEVDQAEHDAERHVTPSNLYMELLEQTPEVALQGGLSTHESTIVEEEEPSTSAAADDSQEKERLKDAIIARLRQQQAAAAEISQTEPEEQTSGQARVDKGPIDESQTFMSKLRKRVGLGGRSSSSQRLKTTSRLSSSGSMRNFTPSIFKKRR